MNPINPGMQPDTAVADIKQGLVQFDRRADRVERAAQGAASAPERPGNKEEHAQTELGGDIRHQTCDPGLGGQRRTQLREGHAGGKRNEAAPFESRTSGGEHGVDVLRPHRHEHVVTGRDQLGDRRERSAAAGRSDLCGPPGTRS